MGLKEGLWWFKIFQMRMTMNKIGFFFCCTDWPKRAEQWSHSTDGATEGKNTPICHPGSVTQAGPFLPDPGIQWRSAVNGSWGEFPACYNKTRTFYIGEKSHETQAGTTQNTSLSMSKSHFRGSDGDNQFMGQKLVPRVLFLRSSIHMHSPQLSEIIAETWGYYYFNREETLFSIELYF